MRTYREGTAFNGQIGRTWVESEPAFPMKEAAPEGAPNVVYVVLDDVGFGWCDTFGGLVEIDFDLEPVHDAPDPEASLKVAMLRQ